LLASHNLSSHDLSLICSVILSRGPENCFQNEGGHSKSQHYYFLQSVTQGNFVYQTSFYRKMKIFIKVPN
jgi:hypothetical protein